ncbi:DUF2799 domain-containing protein [Halobacteriovorax sp.]|uniref:DUF2799 domain-containing protein n=1 Tax=Halobacteriovorax sp. TaxID=2020862 RepID=UPI00356ADB37
MNRFFIIFTILLTFGGCSQLELTAMQCETYDWKKSGKIDGAGGKSLLHSIKNACLESQYIVSSEEEKLYMEGFGEMYCRTKVAFSVGLKLKSYDVDKCSPSSKKLLSRAFTLGKKRGTLKKQLRELDQKRRDIVVDLGDSYLDKELVNNLNSQKLEYEKEIRELERELSSLPDSFIE